ncbi:MAG: zinc metallopeptidase [Trueperaceae bacterium]
MGILLFIITLLVTFGVQIYLRRTYGKWSKVANTSGLTGRDTARAILDANGLNDVPVEPVRGQLSDHYDPRSRTVRLSEDNFYKASVAGAAVAAHEVGHAIQHAKAYAPLQWRSALVPIANIGGNFAPLLIMFGFFSFSSAFGQNMILLGIGLFAAAVLFQFITLPVEFDASRRANAEMQRLGIATTGDISGSKQVLNAAALTYVAAAASSLAYLLMYILQFMGMNSDD